MRVGRGEGGQEGLQHMMKKQQVHQFTWIERGSDLWLEYEQKRSLGNSILSKYL